MKEPRYFPLVRVFDHYIQALNSLPDVLMIRRKLKSESRATQDRWHPNFYHISSAWRRLDMLSCRGISSFSYVFASPKKVDQSILNGDDFARQNLGTALMIILALWETVVVPSAEVPSRPILVSVGELDDHRPGHSDSPLPNAYVVKVEPWTGDGIDRARGSRSRHGQSEESRLQGTTAFSPAPSAKEEYLRELGLRRKLSFCLFLPIQALVSLPHHDLGSWTIRDASRESGRQGFGETFIVG
ncbi:uncharacterized protein CLUP02_02019 [Colletotrichum lupini]|uniref:Uncharacterized protein n=1 Tax=Colletotrichum lupini TaxID=145971 RepID=A0A9Q8WAG0_9PEZI|nr:uncharacterized protein CLUP02_02019 [Colletotrichum lupini]UQC75365.1 hypothetical protein CLUP02_02019 [Colletotrichum lupini]